MGMNIGPMLRSMLGETAVASDVRALELRIGQIVTGVLMEMLDNNEALMNIGGATVRAKLETDLPVGRGTLLQVQPGSTGGTVVLKPLADPSDSLPDKGLKNRLKSFGMPDQKASYELLRGLKRDGYPIGRETAVFFQAASALKPAAADSASWMAAADVAFRRRLPGSEETLTSLHQALFAPALPEAMVELASALEKWQSEGEAKSSGSAQLAGRLDTLLREGQSLLAQGETQLLGVEPARTAGGRPGNAPVLGGPPARTAGGPSDEASVLVGQSAPPLPNVAEASIPSPVPGSAATAGVSAATAVEQAGAALLRPRSSAAGSPPESPPAAMPATIAEEGSAAARPEQGISAPAARSAGASAAVESTPSAAVADGKDTVNAAPRGDSAWIGRFLQWLGTGHENRLLTAADPRVQADTAGFAPGQLPAGGLPFNGETSRGDSLKSALLALAAHDEAPPALRDAAQSLVSQITGQQLLLSSEREPNAPFSLMTMFVPMKGQDGDITATIHVQARRSRKGEWDTDNCRLLFDLRMRHLGDTVVDVHVVDRIVSVKLMNDFPGMREMVEQAREELGNGLKDAGFQLLSMLAQRLPSVKEAGSADSGERNEKPDAPLSSAFAAKPYKGVDVRV